MRFVFHAISLLLLASVHCEFMDLAPVLVTRECAVCLYNVYIQTPIFQEPDFHPPDPIISISVTANLCMKVSTSIHFNLNFESL